MPYHCCVPGCKSNYTSQGETSKTIFFFPKQPERTKLWLRAIHRDNFIPTKSSVVCIDHFDEQFIIREDKFKRNDGTVLTLSRSRPNLTDDAYPTIFKNQPAYMSKSISKKRKAPEERHQEINKRQQAAAEELILLDKIKDFQDFFMLNVIFLCK